MFEHKTRMDMRCSMTEIPTDGGLAGFVKGQRSLFVVEEKEKKGNERVRAIKSLTLMGSRRGSFRKLSLRKMKQKMLAPKYQSAASVPLMHLVDHCAFLLSQSYEDEQIVQLFHSALKGGFGEVHVNEMQQLVARFAATIHENHLVFQNAIETLVDTFYDMQEQYGPIKQVGLIAMDLSALYEIQGDSDSSVEMLKIAAKIDKCPHQSPRLTLNLNKSDRTHMNYISMCQTLHFAITERTNKSCHPGRLKLYEILHDAYCGLPGPLFAAFPKKSAAGVKILDGSKTLGRNVCVRKSLKEFYSIYEPKQKPQLDQTLKHFENRHKALFKALEAKYNVVFEKNGKPVLKCV